MRWRDAYQPIVAHDITCPTLTPPENSRLAWLGGFDLRCISELGVWLRLFEDAGYQPGIRLFLDASQPLEAVLPPSVFARTMVSGPIADWRQLIQPDRPERSFAVLGDGSTIEMLVVGPPTEDVWEEFENRLKRLRSVADLTNG